MGSIAAGAGPNPFASAALSQILWRRSPEVLTRLTSRSIVLSTPWAAAPVCVTGMAMVVWLCLGEERTTEDLLATSARLTGEPRSTSERLTLDALQVLVDLGAVVER